MLNLKSKIHIGLGILFFIILLNSILGILFLRLLSNDSDAIIRDNYLSIDYTLIMLSRLDDIYNLQYETEKNVMDINSEIVVLVDKFEETFLLQKQNITEVGETELVNKLEIELYLFKKEVWSINSNNLNSLMPGIRSSIGKMKTLLVEIYSLNMKSIIKKSEVANKTSLRAITYMTLVLIVSFIVILIYIFNFPGYLISPIKELTEKILEVSQKSFDQKITIKSQDEIGELTTSFNYMAGKLKEYEDQHIDWLLDAKRRIENIVYGLNDGVILLDESLHVILINKAIEKILNLDGDLILNKNISILAESNRIFNKIIEMLTGEDKSNSNTFELIDPSDETIKQYFHLELIKIEKSQREQNSVNAFETIILFKNITTLTEKDLARTSLFAAFSHEMKTPVSSINLSLKLLQNEKLGVLNEEQKKLVSSIVQHSRRLIGVINEMLDYSQLETGKIHLIFEKIEPFQVVDLATSALAILISEKEIDLKFDIEEGLPLVKADLEKSVWSLVNILT
ncbi:MAG: HAMP domain-containing protein, partial [Desulfobulbaceae bacterium]|nr:HAMP domain-containing protein [Desulfobulbaceae bacterium]